MDCEEIKIGDGMMWLCSRGMPRCWRKCGRPSEFQCDFPIGVYKSGKRKGQRRDCNRHLCSVHAKHGVTPSVDFCDEHFPIAEAAYRRRRSIDKNLEVN